MIIQFRFRLVDSKNLNKEFRTLLETAGRVDASRVRGTGLLARTFIVIHANSVFVQTVSVIAGASEAAFGVYARDLAALVDQARVAAFAFIYIDTRDCAHIRIDGLKSLEAGAFKSARAIRAQRLVPGDNVARVCQTFIIIRTPSNAILTRYLYNSIGNILGCCTCSESIIAFAGEAALIINASGFISSRDLTIVGVETFVQIRTSVDFVDPVVARESVLAGADKSAQCVGTVSRVSANSTGILARRAFVHIRTHKVSITVGRFCKTVLAGAGKLSGRVRADRIRATRVVNAFVDVLTSRSPVAYAFEAALAAAGEGAFRVLARCGIAGQNATVIRLRLSAFVDIDTVCLTSGT